MERELTHEVMRYFKAKDSAYCVCCGRLCHYPNRCDLTVNLTGYNEDKCDNCFNSGHSYSWEDFREMRISLRKGGNNAQEAGEKMYHSNKVKQCIEIVKDCEEWRRFKACARCCLQHSTKNCPLPNIHFVRHVIILVWNDIWLRQQLGEMEKCHHHIQRFEEFTRWVFYSGHSQVQNAWRLLAFFIATREAWLKRKGVWHLVK